MRKLKIETPKDILRGGVCPQKKTPFQEKLNCCMTPPEKIISENPEDAKKFLPPTQEKIKTETLDILRGGVLPQKKITEQDILTKQPPPPPKKIMNDNFYQVETPRKRRKYFPGEGGGRKWREFCTSRGGKFELVVVVDKGIQISSKVRKPKIGTNLEINALNKTNKIEHVIDDKKMVVMSSMNTATMVAKKIEKKIVKPEDFRTVEDKPEDSSEDNLKEKENRKSHDDGNSMAVDFRSAAEWTPVRVRKVKLGIERNLGLSPKSFKKKSLKIGKKSKLKVKSEGGRVMGLKSLFEGASPVETKAIVLPNPYCTNLIAAQDKLRVGVGGLYSSGELYQRKGRDWTGKQTRAHTANQEDRYSHPGLGGGGGGSSLSRDEGGSHLNHSQPSATEEDES